MFLMVSSFQGDDEMGEFGGDSPLHIAVMGRDYDTVQQLLENNANVNSQVCPFHGSFVCAVSCFDPCKIYLSCELHTYVCT